MAEIDNSSFDSSKAYSFLGTKQYLVSISNSIKIYDQTNFTEQAQFTLTFPMIDIGEGTSIKKKMEVLSIKANRVESVFGVLIGYLISNYEYECYSMKIFSRYNFNDWMLCHEFDLNPDFKYICHQFEFKNKHPKVLIFTTANFIYEYNYETGETHTIYEY